MMETFLTKIADSGLPGVFVAVLMIVVAALFKMLVSSWDQQRDLYEKRNGEGRETLKTMQDTKSALDALRQLVENFMEFLKGRDRDREDRDRDRRR